MASEMREYESDMKKTFLQKPYTERVGRNDLEMCKFVFVPARNETNWSYTDYIILYSTISS